MIRQILNTDMSEIKVSYSDPAACTDSVSGEEEEGLQMQELKPDSSDWRTAFLTTRLPSPFFIFTLLIPEGMFR